MSSYQLFEQRCQIQYNYGASSFAQAVSYTLKKLRTPMLTIKNEQLSAIQAVYERKDVFVWLPTGFGKSLCYQAVPFVVDYKMSLAGSRRSSTVLVVTSLIALMLDQVHSLQSKGVKSSIITSTSHGISRDLLVTDSLLVSISHLFCVPESLVRSKWRSAIESPQISKRIVAIVVDEAHCVSKW